MYAVKTDEASDVVQKIYDRVIQVSSRVLRNAKLFSIDILKQENPSYAEMAENLTKICSLIDFLVEEDDLKEHQWTCVKARDYARFVADVAKAIENNDEIKLKTLIAEMDKGSFL